MCLIRDKNISIKKGTLIQENPEDFRTIMLIVQIAFLKQPSKQIVKKRKILKVNNFY